MKSWTILLSTLCLFSCNQQENKFEKYVDPLIGTDIRIVQGKDKNSTEERGQIMPAVGVPHGMTNWVAQTQATEQKCHPPYYYFQDAIQGFRASHWMNGSCTQDYGSVTIMPLSNKLEIDPVKRASTFDHTQETATPSYYSVDLNDYDIHAELTGLSRAGIMQFCFEQDGDHYIVIEPNSDEGVAFVEIDPEKKEITGYNPVHRIYQGYGKEAGFNGHFVIQLNEEIADYGVWDSTTITPGRKSAKGQKHAVGAWIKLTSDKPGKILVKVATSFTSIDNARKNLAAEIPGWNFNEVRQASSDIWNQALGQIAVKGNNEKEMVKFYSALYNAHFLPRTFSDVDGSYPRFDGDGQIMKMDHGTYYCDFSQWDTYRAVHPLFSILTPSRNGDMAHSLVLKGQQGGWLPIFPSWNSYTAAMIGDHCIAMIGDAIVKDTPGFDYEEAYTLMRKNAFEANPDSGSYRDGKGRRAMESYLKYNYVPLEDQVTEAFHRREQVWDVSGNRFKHLLYNGVYRLHLCPAPARFSMNSDSHLNLVLADFKDWRSLCRGCAGGKRHAHGTGSAVYFLAQFHQFFQGSALFSGGTAAFNHEEIACHSAAATVYRLSSTETSSFTTTTPTLIPSISAISRPISHDMRSP